jgi:hypothetical protein
MAKTTVKMSLFVFCLVCLSLFSMNGTSYANVTCNVKVEAVYMTAGGGGVNSTGVMVNLRNTTGTTIPGTTWTNNTVRSFFIYKPLGNQGMAIVLTALSNKSSVSANIGGTATPGSLIMYVAVTQTAQ